MAAPSRDALARAARVRLLVLDVDGVLTDGRVIYDSRGVEIKLFDVQDGHGLKLLQRSGVEVCWLSGRGSQANRVRAQELGISELREDCKVKLPVLEEMLAARGVAAEHTAYMGDDLVDLPPMRRVGLALAPANAVVQVKEAAHWVVPRPGGRGAVRRACELVLAATGGWEQVTARYYQD
jgi:3-deoxy-D-manno-octulosonate 8-phosphate phosphatase (KDO 8-P phosphatase)